MQKPAMKRKILDLYFVLRNKARKLMDELEEQADIPADYEQEFKIKQSQKQGKVDGYLEACTMIERYLDLQDK